LIRPSHTELVTLYLLSMGYSRPEVAEMMCVTVEAIKSRLAKARRRTGTRNTCQMMALVIRKGWI
jgi:DNA-binding CsgD family transcriptional regulator